MTTAEDRSAVVGLPPIVRLARRFMVVAGGVFGLWLLTALLQTSAASATTVTSVPPVPTHATALEAVSTSVRGEVSAVTSTRPVQQLSVAVRNAVHTPSTATARSHGVAQPLGPVVHTVGGVVGAVAGQAGSVVNTVARPVVHTVVRPVVNTVVRPVLNTVVRPVVNTIVRPAVGQATARVGLNRLTSVTALVPVVSVTELVRNSSGFSLAGTPRNRLAADRTHRVASVRTTQQLGTLRVATWTSSPTEVLGADSARTFRASSDVVAPGRPGREPIRSPLPAGGDAGTTATGSTENPVFLNIDVVFHRSAAKVGRSTEALDLRAADQAEPPTAPD